MTREGESFTTLSVPVVALDDYFGEDDRVTLLKIDVEGGELGVLKGAERILRRYAPLLVFECENRHLAPGTVGDVFSYLESLGYRGSFVCRDQVLPLAAFDAAVHQRQDGEWFWKSKDYATILSSPKRRTMLSRRMRLPWWGREHREDRAGPGGSHRPRSD